MSGENQVDLGELQRERDKRQAALAEAQSRIDVIEQKARLEREETERKQRELESLEKKLAACRANIAWFEKKIADFGLVAQAQIDHACDGSSEAALNLAGTLAEIAEYELTVAAFKKYESSIPGKIKNLTISA